MRRNPETRTGSGMPRERVVLLILLVLVSLAAGIIAWNNSRSANELTQTTTTGTTTTTTSSTPGEAGSTPGSGTTGSTAGSSTGTAGNSATGATPSAGGAGTDTTPGNAPGASTGTSSGGPAPASGTTSDPATAPVTGDPDSGGVGVQPSVQPGGAVDVPSIPAFGETVTGDPAGTGADPAPTPGGINPDTALATLPGINPFRPLALDERQGGVSSANAAPAPSTVPTFPAVTAAVRPPPSSPSTGLSASGNRPTTTDPVASSGGATGTGSTGNGITNNSGGAGSSGASARSNGSNGRGSSATPAPTTAIPTTSVPSAPAPITPLPSTTAPVTVTPPVTAGGAFPTTLPGASRDAPRAGTVTVIRPPSTPAVPTAITRPPGGPGTTSPPLVTPLPTPVRTVPTPAPVRPPVAGVRVPRENIDLNSVLARGAGSGGNTGRAAGASGTPDSTANAGATSQTDLPTPGTPQPITQLGGDSAAAPLTALDRVIQNQEISLNAAVLGPVNTAILRSKDGFAVVAVGQKLPDSNVVLKEVTADSVTLALGNDTTTLQLDER